MSSKSFVKVLRKVIREEVRAAVKEIITEQRIDTQQVIDDRLGLSEKTKQNKKTFTKNSMLNDILNETAATADLSTMREGPAVMQDEYPSLGSFKSSMAESFGASRQPQTLASTGINGEAINMSNESVAKTVNVMTKDYSGMMAKMREMDKQRGKKGVR